MINNRIIGKVAATQRFSGTHLLQSESIADHSMEMALLCINFSELVPESDKKEMVYRCVIHDLEETLTTDVPRIIKYYDTRIKELLDEAGYNLLSANTNPEFANEATGAKDKNNINGFLVGIADRIQCFLKMKREVEVYGNNALKSDFEAFKMAIHELFQVINDSELMSENSKKSLRSYLNNLIIN